MSENKGGDYLSKIENSSETIVRRENFNKIKSKIELPGENKPRIDIPDYGLKQLEILNNSIDSLKGESEKKGIYAVVRCWNKDIETIIKKNASGRDIEVPGLRHLIDNLKKIKKEIPELKGVYLVISKEDEEKTNGKTIENLQKLLEEENEIPIIPLIITKYTWTSGLNGPIAMHEQLMKEKAVDPKKVMMLFSSFDVVTPDEELKKLRHAIDNNNRIFITFRLDPGGVHPLVKGDRFDTEDPTHKDLLDRYKKLTKSPYEGEIADLVSSNRNTFNLVYSDLLFDFNGFNPLCNNQQFKIKEPRSGIGIKDEELRFYEIPGMEDIEFYTRYLKSADRLYQSIDPQEKIKGKEMLLDFRRALKNPIKYRDKSWEERSQKNIIKKVTDEAGAYVKILDLPLNPYVKEAGSENGREIILGKNGELSEKIRDFKI
jgi:hypothetical protein